eukprot:g77.t1
MGRRGPLKAWDLFVGARINVLGRKTSLMQASNATQEWLDHHGRQLVRLRGELLRELKKYCIPPLHRSRSHFALGGRTNLRNVLEDMLDISETLKRYRPELTKRIISRYRASEPLAGLFIQ